MDFRDRAIKYQITVFMAVMLLMVIVAVVVVSVKTSEQIQAQNVASVRENIEVIEDSLENVLAELNYVSNSLTLHDGIAEMAWQTDGKSDIVLYQSVRSYMFDLLETTESIDNIGFVGYDGTFYNLGFNEEKNDKIRNALERMGKGTKMVYLDVIESTTDETREFLFAANIYDTEQTIDTIGYVILLVSDTYFVQALESRTGVYYLTDGEERIILATDSALLGSQVETDAHIIGKKDWLVDWPMNVVAVRPEVEWTESIIETGMIYIVLISLMLLILVAMYFFLDRRVTRPMKQITSFIQEISQGDLRKLKKRLNVSGSQEVHAISNELNEMLDEINILTGNLVETTSQLYIKEIETREAELNSLKSQINPHFLYNTLAVIRGIAIMRDDMETKAITSALVKIYRYSIKGDDLVEFQKELDICKAYIDVQQIRFKDRFEVEYRLEEDMSDIVMQKMILQPLVENAIVHGVESSSKMSRVIIGSRPVSSGIQVYVEDDGTGIEPDKLQFIKEQLESQKSSAWHKEHVGLLNVHTRLKHMWGSGLTIESEKGLGTIISFIVK